ncbi:MAG: 23S rRNA (pseudouridine(1915)-N(3))-methyltransferase RlmH [Hyphomicrobiales bacterium]|nr:23S rRNA (pseudouridine(1915)-N(3))-methyltransferase RlmH [Hyphomicrobiales bacterium]
MNLSICAIGRLKAGPERQLAERYLGRAGELASRLGFSGPRVVEIVESRARDEATRKREEAAGLAGRSEGAVRIALDERGETLNSKEFAKFLEKHRASGAKSLAFLIGGADGLAPDVLKTAHQTISFGAMTLPHQLARIVLLEQIYRALTIRSGHPYHRA